VTYRQLQSEWRTREAEGSYRSFQLRKPDEEREKDTQRIEELKREQQKKDQDAQKAAGRLET